MLSIIIPTLNEENYLSQLLESIKRQDFDNYEVIVADAGSKDKTRKIAERFGAKVVEGGFQSVGRNRGVEVTQGDLLLFLDADLQLPPGFLEKAVNEFRRRELDIATFPLEFYDGGKFINFLANVFWNRAGVIFEGSPRLVFGAILVRKEIHDKVGGFNEEIKQLGEDYWYMKQISKCGRVGFIRSAKVSDSVRRYERDGYVKTLLKNLLASFYMPLFGPVKTNLFNYPYDHYEH